MVVPSLTVADGNALTDSIAVDIKQIEIFTQRIVMTTCLQVAMVSTFHCLRMITA